ncbi:hypothetical protein NEUTE1DRAFT_130319 [Neurospora tetrasperma FGSC 2508]|uniref:Bms1-type G domain-containing protein n=1 Tax=Neurospora tetrasperma (strain FGSC 2508 / ATCC MYA-4615 / P0657) TaxID=510951 RepID=F8MPK9_NEUT8|nr:uncharacterized protein NEUTE1DRAFT_130319 [Neurospora tetrasperma FGSC 2508]EGO56321.1 hypothetical protein NEUTE1DRAFT_130319 [Neurospora tetrasperma FGSC 2508]EGZ70822.1 DUF663-domain-containing protein [Neurospora tetrasperma FGSC 2509]
MPGAVSGHSHRPTTKASNKPFKSRHSTKGALRNAAKGKVAEERGVRKTPHQQVMSKFDRRNRNKQLQLQKHKEHLQETSIFAGKDGAPRNVAVIPLCSDGDATEAIKSLNSSIDIETEVPEGAFRVPVDRFKQKLQYFPLKRDLTACLDAARVADYVVLVLSAQEEVDELGELILRSVESQGLSTLFTVVQGLNKIEPQKQRLSVLSSLKSYITHFHPEQDKVFSLDNRQECSNLMRSLCSTTPKGIRWRDERSWMLVEEVKFGESTVLTGVVRGKGLKADRLVQVGDWGTFQVEKITAAPLARRKRGEEGMNVEEGTEEILDQPTDDRDDLVDLAPEEVRMEDDDDDEMNDGMTTMTTSKKGVLLDDHHYFSEEEPEAYTAPKKLPKGTSKYQAAWYLDDDVSDSGSDMEEDDEMEDDDEEEAARPEDGEEGLAGYAPTEAGQTEYPQTEGGFIQPDADEDAKQLEAFRKQKRDEAQDDLEFPDEIELHPHVLARERLAKYRGLKSLRSSPWQEDEDRAYQPEDWERLLKIQDYQASKIRASREALVGGVAPGTRVHVYLKDVPATIQQSYNPSQPVTLFSLLRHEYKKTAVNFLINLSADAAAPIKAKEELIIQCGPRRFVINPLFSQGGNTPNDVHKYCRYLHPGQSAVATFTGPVTWGAVPTLFFKRQVPGSVLNEDGEPVSNLPLSLVATGTALPPSTSRVVAKRAILTGHPYHIHKKIVTIRYMFFNREDVEWFKALPLWTRRGRSGFIKEALGTHGYFKATFDGRINPQDSVGVSLYKRVWPRSAKQLDAPLLDAAALQQEVDEDAMDAE